MNPNFKPGEYNTQIQIQDDPDASKGNRVVKTEAGFVRSVQEFNFTNFRSSRPRNSAADTVSQADARFVLSGLAKDALRLEEEERARLEASVQEQVNAIADEAREVGRKQGYDEGFQKGRDDAYAEVRDEFKERLDHLESMIGAVENAKEKMFRASERTLVDIIHHAARMIVLKELSVDREYLGRLAAHLVEKVSIKENLVLKINPRDAESLDGLRAQLVAAFPGMKNLTIETSELVSGGGCALETQWGAIDASVDTQIARIEQGLLDTFNSGTSAQGNS
jgi:flagellar assembly protein FliH